MNVLNQNARALAAGSAAMVAIASMYFNQLNADDSVVNPPEWPWSHKGPMDAYDTASIRRGYQVYKEVCASCHSMKRIAFRNLVNVGFTEKEVKDLANDAQIVDGPNDQGEMFERPGKLFDYFPSPYKNEQEARAANNGAYPPDLSLIVKARPRHEDYIFSLLTGYKEQPPAGVSIRQGLYYNPYFPGGAIAMAPPLSDETVEYPDGTPATLSQMAKDVSTFLAFTSAPEADDRKKTGVKAITALAILSGFVWYHKRFRWNVLKTRRIVWKE